MIIDNILVNGSVIEGFTMRQNEGGKPARIKMEQAIGYVKKGLVPGVGVQNVLGMDILTGIDYGKLPKVQMKVKGSVADGEVVGRSENGQFLVESPDENTELMGREVWKLATCDSIDGAIAGLYSYQDENGKILIGKCIDLDESQGME